MQELDQWIFLTTQAIEIIHIDSPIHSTEVTFLFDPIHLDFHTFGIFITHPLGTFVSVGAFTLFIPLLGPLRSLFIDLSTDLLIK